VSPYLAAIALSALAASTNWTVPPPNAEFQDYGPFSVRSDGAGQLSSGIYTITVHTSGVLQASYTAPREHCSSVRMHFLVDGIARGVSDAVMPGRDTGYVELGPVKPGEHQISLQAEGIPGGCNAGFLTSWGGSVMVYTTHPPPDDTYGIDAIDAGCGGGVIAQGWNVHVSADGAVTRTAYGPGLNAHREPLHYQVPVEQVRALFAQAQAAELMMLTLPQPGERACSLTLSSGAARHTLVWDPSPTPQSAKAEGVFDAAVSMAPLPEYDR